MFFHAAHYTSSEVIDFDEFMSSTRGHSTATMRYWMKKTTNATFGIDKKKLVQVALLEIYGGDGAYLSMLLGSLIGVSSVHLCLICSVIYTYFSYISQTPQLMAIGEIFLCQLVHLDALFLNSINFELRITKILVFLKAIMNSFKLLFETSPPRIVGHEMLCLCVSFAVPSTTRSPLLDDVVLD